MCNLLFRDSACFELSSRGHSRGSVRRILGTDAPHSCALLGRSGWHTGCSFIGQLRSFAPLAGGQHPTPRTGGALCLPARLYGELSYSVTAVGSGVPRHAALEES